MDTKKLVEKLKNRGINEAEDLLAGIVTDLFDWVAEEGIKSENGIIKIVAGIAPVAKAPILEAVDKLDGEDDAGR